MFRDENGAPDTHQSFSIIIFTDKQGLNHDIKALLFSLSRENDTDPITGQVPGMRFILLIMKETARLFKAVRGILTS